MRRGWLLAAVLAFHVIGGIGHAWDTVKTTKANISGRVISTSALQVRLQQAGAAALMREIPVNEIVTVYFDDDPRELKAAKDLVIEGQYAEALASLKRIKKPPTRSEVVQDIEFFQAYCTAKLALAGIGKIVDLPEKPGAGRLMKSFADAHPTSFHYFEASATVGELLLALKQYDQAAEYFGRLGKAPWPEYAMRLGVATGRSLLAQGKAEEAMAAFDKILASAVSSEQADAQRLQASLGKARALVALRQFDRAVALADEVLEKTGDDDASLRPEAYVIQGVAHRQAGRNKEALFAFLHVDFFYPSAPSAHAEAIANLAELWEVFYKNERANAARETLETQYPDSPWNSR